MIVQTYDLTFDTGNVKPHVMFSKYDTSRMIRFVLGFTPTTAELFVNGTSMECLIDGNIVEFLYAATSNVGKWEAELRCDGNGSVNFVIEVEDTPVEENTTVIRNMSLPNKTPLEEPKLSLDELDKDLKELETDIKEIEESQEAEEIGFLNEKENENEEREQTL